MSILIGMISNWEAWCLVDDTSIDYLPGYKKGFVYVSVYKSYVGGFVLKYHNVMSGFNADYEFSDLRMLYREVKRIISK